MSDKFDWAKDDKAMLEMLAMQNQLRDTRERLLVPPPAEKPLHVLVAEALGWTAVHLEPRGGKDGTPKWFGNRPVNDHVYAPVDGVAWFGVPRFDESWSATGPLIERFGIWLREPNEYEYTGDPDYAWIAERPPTATFHAYGQTPLIAVCNLILALHAAGKLPK